MSRPVPADSTRTGRAAAAQLPTAQSRLLSPEKAARYLGLSSKWAVRRLAASGAFPMLLALRKCRYDQRDLGAFIERMKSSPPNPGGWRQSAAP